MSLSPAPLIFLCLLLYLAGMFQVWAWAIAHLIRRAPLPLPRFGPEARAVPWGIGTMILVLLVYLGVNFGTLQVYLLVNGQTGRGRPHSAAVAKADTDKVKPSQLTALEVEQSATTDGSGPQALPVKPTKIANSEDPLLSVTEGMFLLTLINEILIVGIPCILRLTTAARLRDLGLTFVDWPAQLKIGAGGALLVAPIVYLIQFYATRIWTSNDHPVQEMIRNQFTPGVAYLAALSAIVMAPIVEEMMFRGLVQTWLFQLAVRSASGESPPPGVSDAELGQPESGPEDGGIDERSRRPALQAIVVTSFFFAIVHSAQWPAPIPIFLLSLALGAVYHLTGSLLASIAMHATFNGLSTLMLFLAMTADPEGLTDKNPQLRNGSIARPSTVTIAGRGRIASSNEGLLQIP